jgi:hypothetical protein
VDSLPWQGDDPERRLEVGLFVEFDAGPSLHLPAVAYELRPSGDLIRQMGLQALRAPASPVVSSRHWRCGTSTTSTTIPRQVFRWGSQPVLSHGRGQPRVGRRAGSSRSTPAAGSVVDPRGVKPGLSVRVPPSSPKRCIGPRVQIPRSAMRVESLRAESAPVGVFGISARDSWRPGPMTRRPATPLRQRGRPEPGSSPSCIIDSSSAPDSPASWCSRGFTEVLSDAQIRHGGAVQRRYRGVGYERRSNSGRVWGADG